MIRRDSLFGSDSANLNELGDDELIAVIRENNNDKRKGKAISVLISRYLGLIWKKARLFSGNYTDSEDLSQEGLLALLKAISHYNADIGAKFSSFADVCITNRIKSAAVKLGSGTGIPLTDASGNGRDGTPEPSEGSPESIWLEKEFTENLYREISVLLTGLEWKIFRLYLESLSYSDIAKRLCISEKAVGNAIYRARRKLKALLSRGF